nr:gamma-secretase-activating protein-like [Loxodonta africana]
MPGARVPHSRRWPASGRWLCVSFADFDLQRDVLPGLLAQRAAPAVAGAPGGGADILENYDSLRVLNFERNGNIIYTYKDDKGSVFFGLYDCQTRQNEHLYTFETDLQVISCSINSERTLLAVSLVQTTKEGRRNELQPGNEIILFSVHWEIKIYWTVKSNFTYF